ncbi:hypothetical protein BDZ89DRAFT_1138340 [Hymenopellis radicata]|nr:hypothetical protein BDZ89DRAFT_1138340 [Hymenopellis radicata]
MRPFIIAIVGLLFVGVQAQRTLTTTDENAETVVEVVSTDLLGDVVTETLRTLTGTTNTRTTTTLPVGAETTTATTAVGGPVGAPAATTGTPHAPIEYYYTTTVAGQETVIDAFFTPTFPTTTPTTATGTGSIMAYSDYTAKFSVTTTLAASNAVSPLLISKTGLQGLTGVIAALVMCLLGGLPILLL